jgi:hypothetical protein
LIDANGTKVDSIAVTTNEFGSYHGRFTLPQGLLNGQFMLQDDSTDQSKAFYVEEYKRPKFYVSFDTLKTNYRIGDTIRMEGYAKAYAGNGIDGALIKYRVTRQLAWNRWSYNRSADEISHGTLRTDANGRFRISFKAKPDKSIQKGYEPIFEYTISADVTDISGETHTSQGSVKAGYRGLELTIGQPVEDHISADSCNMIVVNAVNLAGIPQPVLVEISIYGLQSPNRLIRERYWPAPDQFILTKEAFLHDFPHDEYGDESDPKSWQLGQKVFGATDSAGKSISVTGISGKGLAPGWYIIEAIAHDANGQPVKTERYVELYDGSTGKPARPLYDWTMQADQTTEPGNRALVSIGSSAGSVFVIRAVERMEEVSQNRSFRFLTLDRDRKQVEIPVTEADRGGLGVSDVFIKDNRIYTRLSTINVPWTNKELSIRYLSYRDKTLPGSLENWEVTIEGSRAEKVASEVLAGMYDASLDQFKPHRWVVPHLYEVFEPFWKWNGIDFASDRSERRNTYGSDIRYFFPVYDRLLSVDNQEIRERLLEGRMSFRTGPAPGMAKFDVSAGYMAMQVPDMEKDADGSKLLMKDSIVVNTGKSPQPSSATAPPPAVQARKDFRETAFFLPDLRTDSAGNVSFSFTMPEAVTSWKWMTLAHTRDLAFGYGEKTIITQKELMVQPNAPRFLREGDRMELPVKVVNLTDSELTGQMNLSLTDPTTGETADGWFTNRQANQYFTVGARQSVVVSFPLDIPYQYNRPVTYKVVAAAGAYSDGEEATLPVVSNRIMVTESLPLNMPGDGTRHFTFDKLLKSGSSETLNHHALTVEFTANPAWYAVQSLPYLMEYPHECSEQVFERVYANALASHIAGASPRLKDMFDRWRGTDTAQLLSNLQKNQELKAVLLEETPWVMQGKSEAQQKKNLALLFDMHRMSTELRAAIDRLSKMQSEGGGFPWWSGGPDNRHITQYILTGIGHLRRLRAVSPDLAGRLDTIVAAALPYLDEQINKDYHRVKARPAEDLIGPMQVHYLYMRSFFANSGLPGTAFAAVNYFRKKAQRDWLKCSPYLQGMIALALYRTGDIQTARDIIASLKQTASRDPERGMYWKGMEGGYYWWQAPVETQSLLIEAFHEISGDAAIDRDLKTWLLKQKQTHSWPTTTATADACYALLMGGDNWLNAERSVDMRLGDKTIDWPAGSGDAGVGYNKKVFDGAFVNPTMGNINVSMETKGGGGSPAWGAVYWQYFDMSNRITPPGGAKPALSVMKKLFIRRNTDRGPLLEPLADNGELKPGDRVVARIELRADRDMEYVHMKDMRAACLEPVNVLSQYKWQDGLGYYESTKDASTDFFFDVLPRGTYVFEYDMLAGQSGNFSNGITTIECLYAPEFTWHTEGIRVNVETGN